MAGSNCQLSWSSASDALTWFDLVRGMDEFLVGVLPGDLPDDPACADALAFALQTPW